MVFAAGTSTGAEHAPTFAVVVVLKPSGPVTLKPYVPVKVEPDCAFLQTSM